MESQAANPTLVLWSGEVQSGFGLSISIVGSVCTPVLAGHPPCGCPQLLPMSCLLPAEGTCPPTPTSPLQQHVPPAVTYYSGICRAQGGCRQHEYKLPFCHLHSSPAIAVGTCHVHPCSNKHFQHPRCGLGDVTTRAAARSMGSRCGTGIASPPAADLATANAEGSRHPWMAESPESFSSITRSEAPAPPR